MTRENIIKHGLATEVLRLTKEIPNDMELGKTIRNLNRRTEEQLKRLREEEPLSIDDK